MLVAGPDAAAESLPRSKLLVAFENEGLSVKADDVPLKDLLSEIEAKSAIVMDIKDKAAAKRSSVDFKNLPPVLAFQSILRDLNFAFFYSGTRLMRVLILPAEVQPLTANGKLMKANPVGRRLAEAKNPPLKRRTTPTLPGGSSQDSDIMAKLDAIAAMEESDDAKSIAALGEALTDRHPKVKQAALTVLAAKKGGDVTEMLRRGLNDSDPEFRTELLEILADRGDLDSLRKALADRNQEVRENAADLLWNFTIQK
jgi:hypothetical protein